MNRDYVTDAETGPSIDGHVERLSEACSVICQKSLLSHLLGAKEERNTA